MNRLGLLPPTALEGEQKQVYDEYNKEIHPSPARLIETKDDEGCLLGPAGVLIHNPDVLEQWNGLRKAMSKMAKNSSLPQHVQEIASLVVGARTEAAYEIYSHSKSSGFPQEFLDDIRLGCCPAELDEKGRMAFEVATELGKPGALSSTVWQKSVEVLGVEGTSTLIQFVGFYTFLATISNGFDVQLPTAYVSSASSSNNSARNSISSSLDDRPAMGM